MVTLTTRKAIIATKKIIGSQLAKMQKTFYSDEMLQYYKDDNEEHLYQEQFDCFKNDTIEYCSHNKIICLSHSDIHTFTNTLTNKLAALFEVINVNDFIIIAHLKLDFFGNRENEYNPLVNAYHKLEKITGQSSYKEAFKCSTDNLGDFIEILFWITRCDPAVAEYIFLFNEDETIQIQVCKYGNIHLTQLHQEILTDEKLVSLGWNIIDGPEFDNFSNDGKITGRQIKI